jgi:glycosyltransferase involved in cell wall biosynthesis
MGEPHNHVVNWSGSNFDLTEGFGYHSVKFLMALHAQENFTVKPLTIEQLALPLPLIKMAGVNPVDTLFFVGRLNRINPVKYPGRIFINTMYESTKLPGGWAEQINKTAAHVVVPSPWLEEVFIDAGVDIPITTIQEGIDPKDFPIVDWKPSKRPYTFLCLADRGIRKGFDIAYAAFYRAFANNPNVRLLIKAKEDNPHLQMLRNGKTGQISLWEYNAPSMADVYAMADCFIFPSRGEGYGLPPREFAATGKPVIALSQHGTFDVEKWGIPINEFVMRPATSQKGGGDWFEPDNNELTEKLLWCYNNQEKARQIGLNGAEWLRQNQTWELAGKKLAKLMQNEL